MEQQLTYQDYHNVITPVKNFVSDPVSSVNQNLPCRFNLLKTSDIENKVCDKWLSFMDRLHRDKFILVNEETKEVLVRRKLWGSRYHSQGQKKIKRKLTARLGSYYHKRAILLGGTFDPKRISRYQAWVIVNSEFRSFMDQVNKWRSRHGFKKRLSYFHVIEAQKNGMPHWHVVFPSLRYLAPIEVIEGLWGHGSTSVKQTGGLSAASYACKYIGKLGENALMASYMFHFKLRNYSFSRSYVYRQLETMMTGWHFVLTSGLFGVKEKVGEYLSQGFTVSGLHLIDLDTS